MLNVTNYNIKSWREYFEPNENNKYNVSLNLLPITHDWDKFMDIQKTKPYWEKINMLLTKCTNSPETKIYPYPELVFNSLNTISLDNIKVFILGQDPYFNNEVHNKKIIPQAMGVSFSVPVGVKIPSSLSNIHRNLLNNGLIKKMPDHGNLMSWVNQGCMLFNATLTVQHGIPNSHQKYWQNFSNELIKYISDNTNNIVFILWGKFALDKLEKGLIDDTKHKVLVSSHPSGLSNTKDIYSKILNKKYSSFSNSNNFKEANDYLVLNNKIPINWDY